MKWITLIICLGLAVQVIAKQSSTSTGVKSKRQSERRTVRLDPLLRRALLRALTELEREAQEKIKLEEEEKARTTKKRGNDLNESNDPDEIQKTADTRYPTPSPSGPAETDLPQEPTTTTAPDSTDSPFPVTIKDAFFFHTPTPIEHEFTSPGGETRRPDVTIAPPDVENVETNLIAEPKFKENFIEATDKPDNELTTLKPDAETTEKDKDKETEVELFKAPLVAAFTLHQDHRGTPQSVIPLLQTPLKPPTVNSQNFFTHQQQHANLIQQQQFGQQRQNLVQQPQQQQFIPSVTITPFSQPNDFNNNAQRAFSSFSTGIPSSTAFPPLASNSIASGSPSQSFHVSSTLAPLRNNNFGSTPAPIVSTFGSTPAPFVSTSAPQSGSTPSNAVDVSIVQSHVFNLPNARPNLIAPSPTVSPLGFAQQFNIPQVTLPLQNEPRLNFNQNQNFLDRQKRVEEQNRLRFIEEQKKQNAQRQLSEANRLRQAEDERKPQQQQQPRQPEQNVDFQKSVGFTFEITPKPAPAQHGRNPFPPFQQQFDDLESRNRVNRQEGFGSTGNLGFNRIPQFQKDQRGFGNNNQFQQFAQLQQYRTIPDEHYRALQSGRFQQFQQSQHFPQSQQFQQFQQSQQVQQFQPRFPPNVGFQQFRQFPPQPTPPPVTKQLENLLLQSGVTVGEGSQQEDLNIVSKVLALNHERRSDPDFDASALIERSDTGSDSNGKDLLVGEISEMSLN